MPGSWYSTGSSIVMMFFSGVLIAFERRVERRRLARAGRPGDQHGAVGLAEARARSARARRRRMPSVSRSTSTPRPCRGCACTIASPCTLGSVTTRRSIVAAVDASGRRGRPAGSAPLGDVEVGHDLHAADRRRRPCGAGPWRASLQHAVDAEAHAHARAPSGSKWMSEAPCSTAWAMIELTSLMTGASSADSRRSTTSAGALLLLLVERRRLHASSSRFRRAISAAMSSREATAGADLVAGHQRDVVDARARSTGRPSRRAACARRRSDRAPRRSAWRPREVIRLAAPMSTLKTVRSTWSRPKRSAVARASWSGVSTPRSQQDLLGRRAAGARGLDRRLDALARSAKPELDDDVGQEARPRRRGGAAGDPVPGLARLLGGQRLARGRRRAGDRAEMGLFGRSSRSPRSRARPAA